MMCIKWISFIFYLSGEEGTSCSSLIGSNTMAVLMAALTDGESGGAIGSNRTSIGARLPGDCRGEFSTSTLIGYNSNITITCKLCTTLLYIKHSIIKWAYCIQN